MKLKIVLGVGLLAATAWAQQFDVASVKRSDQCPLSRSFDPGSVTLNGVPLKIVLMTAFDVKIEQIEGPSWLDTDCFDISARIPQGVSQNQLPTMLRALLTERFKLAVHTEDRPKTGYALVVDKAGPKLKQDDPNTNFMGKAPAGSAMLGMGSQGKIKGVMGTASLARLLSNRGYGPIEDATGLTGKYDIDLSWTPDPAFESRAPGATASATMPPGAEIPAPGATLFTALQEQLGLKLERRSVLVQFVVIDHIERTPTSN